MNKTTEQDNGCLDEIICRNRVYRCLGCDFVGREEEADTHQTKCDNPMELIK